MFIDKKLNKHLTLLSVIFNVYESSDRKNNSNYYEFVDKETKKTVISVYTYKKAKCIAEGIRLGFVYSKIISEKV